jgi:putative membrane protein
MKAPTPGRRERLGPIVFEDAPPPRDAEPANAPPPPDAAPIEDAAGARAIRAAARRPSRFAQIVWGALVALVGLGASIAAYDFVYGLFVRNPVLGSVALSLAAVVAAGALIFALREMAALARLGRIDSVRQGAEKALAEGDRKKAVLALRALARLYRARRDLEWGVAKLRDREADLFDADGLIGHAERALMADLDKRAEQAVGRAARSVAAITAFVPMALVDVVGALYVNLRMIRQIAEIYGGRAGWLGSWRLLRAVAGHLVATGVVSMGDDLLGPALGGGALAKISRRFGEGLINGALTARVGAAAIDVCRPLPFHAWPRPSGRKLAAGALTGFTRGEASGRT